MELTQDDLYLCEFNASTSNNRIYSMKKDFEKIHKKNNEFKRKNHGFIGRFLGAKSIWTFGADGLHMSLRIGNHTIKTIILFSIEYSEFLQDNPSYISLNHPNNIHYKPMKTDDIIKHFKDCCHIPFNYDKNNPRRLKIKSG